MSNSTLVLALCVFQIALICAFIFVLKHYCSMLPFRLVGRMFRECGGKGTRADDREALVPKSPPSSPYPQYIPSIYSPQMMPQYQPYPGYPMSPTYPMSPQPYPMGQQPFQMGQQPSQMQPFPGQQQPYMMSSSQAIFPSFPSFAMNQPLLMPPTMNYPHQMGIIPSTPPAPPSYTTANAQAGTEKQEAEGIIQN